MKKLTERTMKLRRETLTLLTPPALGTVIAGKDTNRTGITLDIGCEDPPTWRG